MAAKKKTKKKQARSTGKKVAPTKKVNQKRGIHKNKSAKKKPATKKAAVKTKAVGAKTIGTNRVSALKKRAREKDQSGGAVASSPQASRSGRQSGDLQGLSSVEGADSESVGELLEEGNEFEADAVKGVEDAGSADEKEVRTHEVPEDDVPGEYLDKD